ncbi:MAG: hypothetical protein WDM79_00025 [Terricaulis sp.]
MADDARSIPNAALLETSFLYGANALFVEEMHARYLADPTSVDPSWRSFFESLNDAPGDVQRAVDGPSWYRPEIAQPKSTETTALLDGNWPRSRTSSRRRPRSACRKRRSSTCRPPRAIACARS